MDKKHCVGCSDNFYNGNNEHGIQKCWCLDSAKLIWRKEVAMDQRPPWTQKAKRLPNCYRRKGFICVGPKQTY